MESPIILEFYELSEYSPIIYNCYTLWKYKQLTLEQSLELAVTELVKTCNNLAEQLQSKDLTPCDGCIDYVHWIKNSAEYSLSLKMRYLVKYYKALFDLLVTHVNFSSEVRIYLDNVTLNSGNNNERIKTDIR